MDYAKASSLLTGRCANRRKVANNTYLERRDNGAIAVKLHATDVLTLFPDGRVLFDTGGWRTVTTKERINRFAPEVTVWSNRGVWYAGVSGVGAEGDTVVFAEGMVWDGEAFHGARTKEQLKAEQKERRDVAKFAKRYLDALVAGDVAAPGAGDCFFCQFKPTDGSDFGGAEHLRAHVKESYLVPSLLVRVIFDERSGASQSMKEWVASFWQEDVLRGRQGGERARVEKALRKYMLKSLGHAA